MKHLLRKHWLVALIIVVVMLIPIVIYVWKFGFVISNSHSRWGEMGSAMSGIYAPILAFLTLVVLGYQVYLQNKFSYLENDLHQTQEAKNEIEYYLSLIKAELANSLSNNQDVIDLFAYSPLDSTLRLSKIAKKINQDNPSIGAAWVNCNNYFYGLQCEDRYPYSTTLTTLKNKAICILSFKTCAALDAYVWYFSDGVLELPHLFYKFNDEQSKM